MKSFSSRTTILHKVAAAVLVVGLLGLVSCSKAGAGPRSEGNPGDLVELPRSHAAVQILASGADTYDEFVEALSDADNVDRATTCAQGGWQLCLVWSEGVLAVVPFLHSPGDVVRVTADGLSGPVVIPMDIGRPVGLASPSGPGSAIIEDRFGTHIGEVSGRP